MYKHFTRILFRRFGCRFKMCFCCRVYNVSKLKWEISLNFVAFSGDRNAELPRSIQNWEHLCENHSAKSVYLVFH